jgi:hypothetical protein
MTTANNSTKKIPLFAVCKNYAVYYLVASVSSVASFFFFLRVTKTPLKSLVLKPNNLIFSLISAKTLSRSLSTILFNSASS